MVVRRWRELEPLVPRLDVDRPNSSRSLPQEVGNKVSADEPTGTGDYDEIIVHQ
jgi:hypothetical protein